MIDRPGPDSFDRAERAYEERTVADRPRGAPPSSELYALPSWKQNRFPDKDATWKVHRARARYRCEKANPRPPDCAGDVQVGESYLRVTVYYYRGPRMRELRRRPIRLCASCAIHYGLASTEPLPEFEVGTPGGPNERRREWRRWRRGRP